MAESGQSTAECPHCRKSVANDGTLSLQIASCPHCGEKFRMPPIVTLAESVPTHRKRSAGIGPFKMVQDYSRYCGTRSFAFQTLLIAWTACMLLVAVMMLVSAVSSASDDGVTTDTEAGAAAIFGICCPSSIYVLLAIPLGIAAIATFEGNKEQ